MRLVRSLLLVLAATLFVTAAPSSADAARATSIKFWVSEFRVTQEMPTDVPEGEVVLPSITLELTGRASAYGGEKVEFQYKVSNAQMWLHVLHACAGGGARLSGVVAGAGRIDEDSKMISGEGPLAELTCRQILK
jgi:hypothetical protein